MTSAIVSTCAMLSALVSTQLLEPQCAVLYVQVLAILVSEGFPSYSFLNFVRYFLLYIYSMCLSGTFRAGI